MTAGANQIARFPCTAQIHACSINIVLLTHSRNEADELEPIVEQIFEAMHDLYIKWKARSFLLIDVPPMHRSPRGNGIIIFKDPATNYLFSVQEKR